MAAQVGIADYKDLINKELVSIRDKMSTIVLDYKKLISTEAVENRESEEFEKYSKQYTNDISTLTQLREYSQSIADFCNNALFMISKDAIIKHVYNYD